MNKPAFPSKTSEEVKEAHASSPSSSVEVPQRDLQKRHSADMQKIEALRNDAVQFLVKLRREKKQQEYNDRLAQFIVYHFDTMDWEARYACGKGFDLDLHEECDHERRISAERARDDYSEVVKLKKEVGFCKSAIRESELDVEAGKLKRCLEERIEDRLKKMAAEYGFDDNVALCDQAMSIAVRYDVDYRAGEDTDVLNAFFNTCCAEYDPVETRDLLSFLQNKYPEA